MSNEIPKLVYEICDRILSCVEVEQIILFGSYAYGTPREDSDYDFYVILPDDSPLGRSEAINLIRNHISEATKYRVSVDILANYKNRYEELNTLPTLERKIKREGVVVYDRHRPN
ncbi:MAG: nucleotidyltransferase domain-containing protein [Planctomycetaceae bacterium]|jgi:predicted nucleotidyltransferase|nr:nucleotidyltransferase domain-containing protein [Planctomycetaceae bacterium]